MEKDKLDAMIASYEYNRAEMLEANAKLRAELEAAKDSLKIMRGADKDNVKIAEVCFKLEAENTRLRNLWQKAKDLDCPKYMAHPQSVWWYEHLGKLIGEALKKEGGK